MPMIRTCVIFCGGYGTRLKSITKNKPKPMVSVQKKPFLEHLLIQLKEQGIKKVFLLVGYKKNQIIKYFNFGKKLGLKIEYSFNPPNIETGLRLNSIKKKINEDFLVMYSDNYCAFNLNKNYEFFRKNKSLITFSVSRKKFGNINFVTNCNVSYHLKRRKNLKFVEIGYMICSKKILKYLSSNNVNFNTYFKNKFIKKRLTAIETFNKYLSISDKKRLEETRQYFKKKNIILIDRDGVINKINPYKRYVTCLEELKMNYKVISTLKKYPKIKLICISNQAGISTKDVKISNLNIINKYIKNFLKSKNIILLDYFISTDHFNSKSFLRKPNPGNFLKAAEKYKLLLDKTFYIGDDPRDVLASYNANTKCIYLGGKLKLNTLKKNIISDTIIFNLSKSIKNKLNSKY